MKLKRREAGKKKNTINTYKSCKHLCTHTHSLTSRYGEIGSKQSHFSIYNIGVPVLCTSGSQSTLWLLWLLWYVCAHKLKPVSIAISVAVCLRAYVSFVCSQIYYSNSKCSWCQQKISMVRCWLHFFSFGSHGFESKLANVGNVCAGWLAGWLDFKVCDLSKSYKHLMAFLEFGLHSSQQQQQMHHDYDRLRKASHIQKNGRSCSSAHRNFQIN